MLEESCFIGSFIYETGVLRARYVCSLVTLMLTNIPEINILDFKGVLLPIVFNIQK